MGYYIEVPENHGKAQQIVDIHGGTILERMPETFADIPEGQALICVVDNGPFEAAAFCYNEEEFAAFNTPDDVGPSTVESNGGMATFHMRSEIQEAGRQRPRTWVLIDWDKASDLTGFTPDGYVPA